MSKYLALALLAAGIILLAFGLNAGDSVTSDVSEAVTGTPSDKSMWLIGLGAVGIIVGGAGLFLKRRALP